MVENKPVVILGGGGHARVLVDIIAAERRQVLGIVSPHPTDLCGIPWLGNDDVGLKLNSAGVELVNGLGATDVATARDLLFRSYRDCGFGFASLVHPSAIVAPGTSFGMGVQIFAGAIVQPGCKIGENVIINTGAIVDHDCVLADSVHIGTGATLCGGVSVGSRSMIGAGAVIIQYLSVGKDILVPAGKTVKHPVPNIDALREAI